MIRENARCPLSLYVITGIRISDDLIEECSMLLAQLISNLGKKEMHRLVIGHNHLGCIHFLELIKELEDIVPAIGKEGTTTLKIDRLDLLPNGIHVAMDGKIPLIHDAFKVSIDDSGLINRIPKTKTVLG